MRNESNRCPESITFQTTHVGHDNFQSLVEEYHIQALIDHKSKTVEGDPEVICKIEPPFHTNNSFRHILNIQTFLSIDENSHAFVGLENEVSKEAMHASKWSCTWVICTEKRMRKKFMGSE